MSAVVVNQAGLTNQTGTTHNLAATSLTAGNVMAVAVRCSNSRTVSTITDTALNTYTLVKRNQVGSEDVELWRAENVTGHASNVVSVTLTGSSGSVYIRTIQLSGFPTSSTFVGGSGLDGTSANCRDFALSTGSYTTTADGQCILLVLNALSTSRNWVPSPGWTEINDDGTLAIHMYGDALTGVTIPVYSYNSTHVGAGYGVSGLFNPTPVYVSGRLSQETTEVGSTINAAARLSQLATEVGSQISAAGRLSQLTTEVGTHAVAGAVLSQMVVEVLSDFTATAPAERTSMIFE